MSEKAASAERVEKRLLAEDVEKWLRQHLGKTTTFRTVNGTFVGYPGACKEYGFHFIVVLNESRDVQLAYSDVIYESLKLAPGGKHTMPGHVEFKTK